MVHILYTNTYDYAFKVITNYHVAYLKKLDIDMIEEFYIAYLCNGNNSEFQLISEKTFN